MDELLSQLVTQQFNRRVAGTQTTSKDVEMYILHIFVNKRVKVKTTEDFEISG